MRAEKFKIALFEPEIPQNTGNIARLCACTDVDLYLIGKLGFSLSDKYLKRAGLDYWEDVNVRHLNSLDELVAENPDSQLYFLSTKARKIYTEQNFSAGDILVFGSETKGLPDTIIKDHIDISLRIPMKQDQRSLNLSNSASIVLYEAIRQTNYIQ
jgi:tRNA (cytidine/uridine-2'-O-)-methyltransferase